MTLAVVIESTWQATALAPWAARLSRAREQEEVLLLVTTAAKGHKKSEARKAAAKAAARKPAAAAVREAVGDAADRVRDAMEGAVEETAEALGLEEHANDEPEGPPPAARPAEPENPLEAAVHEALQRAEWAEGPGGPLLARVQTVEIAPEDQDRPDAGLEDLLDRLEEEDTSLLLLGASESRRDDNPLADRLFRSARCQVVVVRPPPGRTSGAEPGEPRPAAAGGRILVPTAGGPHAALALRLAAGLAAPTGGGSAGGPAGVDAFYVQKDVGPESRGLAQRKLRAAVRKALNGPLGFSSGGPGSSTRVGEVVRIGDSFPKALAAAIGEGRHGVLMVGAADRVQAKRALFNGLPEDLLRDRGENGRGVTLMVVREEEALAEAAGRVARDLVRRWIPQLDREGRISLVERIEGPSRWSTDFVALMVLSTAIATFGEMQDSTAVVIGAMLVAPLMTPLVGCGLAVVQGNTKLVRGSARSVSLGFLVAFGVALLMGLLIPFPGLTSEVFARGRPTLLDLGVAFVSGLAAAYAVARPNLSGALPGVAIAAALVPPIAAAGLAFASGAWWVGGGGDAAVLGERARDHPGRLDRAPGGGRGGAARAQARRALAAARLRPAGHRLPPARGPAHLVAAGGDAARGRAPGGRGADGRAGRPRGPRCSRLRGGPLPRRRRGLPRGGAADRGGSAPRRPRRRAGGTPRRPLPPPGERARADGSGAGERAERPERPDTLMDAAARADPSNDHRGVWNISAQPNVPDTFVSLLPASVPRRPSRSSAALLGRHRDVWKAQDR